MKVVLAIVGVPVAIAVLVLKALWVDQVRGQIQRRIAKSIEATIASLPSDLEDEWAEEWRAELEAVLSMPITAALFARGVRQSAVRLTADLTPLPARAGEVQATAVWLRRGARGLARLAGSTLLLALSVFGLYMPVADISTSNDPPNWIAILALMAYGAILPLVAWLFRMTARAVVAAVVSSAGLTAIMLHDFGDNARGADAAISVLLVIVVAAIVIVDYAASQSNACGMEATIGRVLRALADNPASLRSIDRRTK